MENNKDNNRQRFFLRPYSRPELGKLYQMSSKSMQRQLNPYIEMIGKRNGRYYSVKQVEAIMKLLGRPRFLKDEDE